MTKVPGARNTHMPSVMSGVPSANGTIVSALTSRTNVLQTTTVYFHSCRIIASCVVCDCVCARFLLLVAFCMKSHIMFYNYVKVHKNSFTYRLITDVEQGVIHSFLTHPLFRCSANFYPPQRRAATH